MMISTGYPYHLFDAPMIDTFINAYGPNRENIRAPVEKIVGRSAFQGTADGSYTLRPDNPHKIAVYETVDAQFILNDLFARLRFQYGQAE